MTTSQITLALLTIICSGVVSAVVTYKLNKSRDEQQFLRKKLEEITLAFAKHSRTLGIQFIQYQAVMAGKISYNDALDMTIISKTEETDSYETLSMLTNIYFPHLLEHLEKLNKYCEIGGDIIEDFKKLYINGKPSSKSHNKALSDTIVLIGEQEAVFTKAIREEANILNKKAF